MKTESEMKTPPADQSAYPFWIPDDHSRSEGMCGFGLTKREEFAKAAMAAIVSSFRVSEEICNTDPRYKKQADGHFNFSQVVALNAVEFADALLTELERTKQNEQAH